MAKNTIEKNTVRDLYDPAFYTNRELSWLDFNYRILDEARDKTNPLFERLKFLSITASNLDEFFMVRVASLMDMVHAKVKKPDLAGLLPEEQLEQVRWMSRMWQINHLGNCGPDYAVEFAEQYQIKYSYQMVVDLRSESPGVE